MAVIDIALFLGQSNNAGNGQPLYLLANHSHLLSLSGVHTIWNQQTQADETITPGVNCNTTKYGMQTTLHGPEVNFAYQWNQAAGTSIHVFKHAVVGTLGNTRVSTLPIWNKTAAEIYPVMLAELAALEAEIVSDGDTANYVGLFWIQGESDVGANNALDYLANLKTFIADVRADLDTPTLPLHIVRLHDNFSTANQVRANAVRAAQWQAVTDLADPNVTLIDTDAFSVGGDEIHFDDAGIHALGAQCYTQTTLDNPGVGSSVLDTDSNWLTEVGFPEVARVRAGRRC